MVDRAQDVPAAFLERLPLGVVAVSRDLDVHLVNARARSLLRGLGMRTGHPLDGELLGVARRLVVPGAQPQRMVLELRGRAVRVWGVPAQSGGTAYLLVEDALEEAGHARVTADFVRNAAHQFRTPLTAITAAIQILESGAKDDPAARDRFLEHIDRHTTRLVHVVRALLVLARYQSGEAPLLEPVRLRPLLDALAAAVEPEPGVAVTVACPEGVTAVASSELLEEAVSAILENAVAHTARGSIRLEAATEDGWVSVDVSDTGGGIAPDDRDRIFEPFYRASSDGVGLGLSIAAEAVAAMGGTIDVEDTGGGTHFAILLRQAS